MEPRSALIKSGGQSGAVCRGLCPTQQEGQLPRVGDAPEEQPADRKAKCLGTQLHRQPFRGEDHCTGPFSVLKVQGRAKLANGMVKARFTDMLLVFQTLFHTPEKLLQTPTLVHINW